MRSGGFAESFSSLGHPSWHQEQFDAGWTLDDVARSMKKGRCRPAEVPYGPVKTHAREVQCEEVVNRSSMSSSLSTRSACRPAGETEVEEGTCGEHGDPARRSRRIEE